MKNSNNESLPTAPTWPSATANTQSTPTSDTASQCLGSISEQADAAKARILAYVNRSAGQHMRAIRGGK